MHIPWKGILAAVLIVVLLLLIILVLPFIPSPSF